MTREVLINKLKMVYNEIYNGKCKEHAEFYSLIDWINKYLNNTYLPGFILSDLP